MKARSIQFRTPSYRLADPHCVPARPPCPQTPGSQSQLPAAAALVAFSAHLCEKYSGGYSGGRQGGVPRYVLQRPERPCGGQSAPASRGDSQPASQSHLTVSPALLAPAPGPAPPALACWVPLPLPLPPPLEPGTCNHFRFHFPGRPPAPTHHTSIWRTHAIHFNSFSCLLLLLANLPAHQNCRDNPRLSTLHRLPFALASKHHPISGDR